MLVKLLDGENVFFHRIFQIGHAVGNIVSGFHYIGQWEAVELTHIQPAPQPIDKRFFRQIKARFFHQVVMADGNVTGPIGRAGIFQDTAHLRIGQVKFQQAVHQPDRLSIAFEMAEVLTDAAAQTVKIALAFVQTQCTDLTTIVTGRLAAAAGGIEPLGKPVVNRGLAKVTKGRVADVVHQTGHFNNAFKGIQ